MAHRYFYYVLSKPVLFAKVPLWEFPYRQNEGTSMRTIIEMAREARLPEAWISETGVLKWSELEAFAALVREDEREACAKVCDDNADIEHWQDETSGGTRTGLHAKLIRARGEA